MPLPSSLFGGRLSRVLVPASWAYGAVARARRGWLTRRAARLDRPVISVGNITCGGTGKTPVVEMVARDVLGQGLRPAILSRGYGAPSARRGGAKGQDEYQVLQANLPGVPHLQGRDRVALGREAIRDGGQVLVLDDGFQHVRLHRDLDFVLIDAIVPFGFGRVLPAGLLREPLDALSRAHLLGITRADQVEPKTRSTLSAYLRNRFPGIPQVQLVTHALEWVSLSGERELPEALRDRTALAFCGIGNPEAFRRQALSLGVKLRGFVGFRDHHGYTEPDIEGLAARAKDLGAEQVIMTQKDAVKISSPLAASWKFLRIEARIARGEDEYRATLARSIGKSPEHAR